MLQLRPLALAVALMAALVVPSSSRAGALFTFDYSGPVTDILPFGSDTIDDEFTLGETVNISLTYDPLAPETASTIANPDFSIFEDASISFTIEFVESGRFFEGTGGAFAVVSVTNLPGIDDVGTAVQSSVGDTIVGTLEGMTPTLISMDFLDFDPPDMLSDDRLPAVPFVPGQAQLIFSNFPANVTVTVGGMAPGGDGDGDGVPDAEDNCPAWPNTQVDTDGNGIGDACECGDQNGDGTINISDILAINNVVFEIEPASALCDANDDGACNIGDILGVNARLFGAPTFCQQSPAP